MNPVLLKPTSDRASQVVVHGPGHRGADRGRVPRVEAGAAARGARRPRRPAGAVRRRDLRGRRQPGRDQPARRRHRQPAAGPGRGPAGDRGRRHRPGRGVRLALRHGGPAARRPAGVRAGVRRQQAAGRPRAAGRRLRRPRAPLRRAHAGRGADGAARRRRRHRQRGLARPRPGRRPRPRRRAPAATCSTSPRCAGPGCPTPATSTRCASSRGCGCGGCGRWPSWGGPTWSCCRGRRTPGATSTGSTRTGLAAAVERSDAAVVAVCAGLQMVGGRIDDPDGVEGPPGGDKGLGWLPVTTDFRGDKVLDRPAGAAVDGPAARAAGGRLPHPPRPGRPPAPAPRRRGSSAHDGDAARLVATAGWPGRPLHGLFESDGFRAGVLAWAAERAGKRWAPGGLDFAAARLARLDRIADLLEAHLDLDRLAALIAEGAAVTAARRPSARGARGRLTDAGAAPALAAGAAGRAAGRRRAGVRRPGRRPRRRSPPRSRPRPRAGAATTRRCWPRCGGRPTPTGWRARRWPAGCCRGWRPTCGPRRWRSASPAAARPRSCTSSPRHRQRGRRPGDVRRPAVRRAPRPGGRSRSAPGTPSAAR